MGPLLVGMLLAAQAPAGPAGPLFLVPSPRGGTMADLFLVDPATGDSKNVTRTEADEELYPAWSPDGKRIAFTAKNRDHSFEVFVSDADGSDRKRLTTPPAGGPTMCLFPTWSADGKEVAYSRTDPAQKFELRVVAADGSDDRLLAADGHAPAWSPDGKSVAFMRVVAHKPCALCLIAPDGTGERVLVADTGRSGAGSVAWSPDGTLIAYSAETPYGLQLFVVPAAGGAPRQLTHLPGINVHPVWLSADRLMFSNLRQMNTAGGAYGVINLDGTRMDTHPLTRTETVHVMIRPAVSLRRPAAKPEQENPVRAAAFTEPAAAKPGRAAAPVAAIPPPGPGAGVHLAWSADGKQVAVAAQDGTVVLAGFDGTATRPLDAFRGHTGPVEAVGFSPDGKRVYSGGDDKSVRTWDLGLKGSKGIETDHTGAVCALAVSPDGKLLATAGKDGVLKVRDAETGKPGREVAVIPAGKKGEVRAVVFGADGKAVFAAGGRWDIPVMGGFVAAFDPDTGAELWRAKGSAAGVWALSLSPDGVKLAGACLDAKVRVWDAKTGAELACWTGHADRVTGVAWCPDGKLVASCGTDHTVRLWDAETGVPTHTLAAHSCPAVRVAFSPDGHHLASTGATGPVIVWRVE